MKKQLDYTGLQIQQSPIEPSPGILGIRLSTWYFLCNRIRQFTILLLLQHLK